MHSLRLSLLLSGISCALLFAEPTYIGFDGEQHTINPDEFSVSELASLASQLRSQMYQHGGTGLGTLQESGGDRIIGSRLSDRVRELIELDSLAEQTWNSYGRDARSGNRIYTDAEWSEALAGAEQQLQRALTGNIADPEIRERLIKEARASLEYIRNVIPERDRVRLAEMESRAASYSQRWPSSGRRSQEPDLDRNSLKNWQERLADVDRKVTEMRSKLSDYEREIAEEERRGRVASDDWRRKEILRLKSEIAVKSKQWEPRRRFVTLLSQMPAEVASTQNELFDLVPKTLSGRRANGLSAEMVQTLRQRMQSDPEYARRFMESMTRNEQGRNSLSLGSAQALDLFLEAGRANPKAQPNLAGGVKVLAGETLDVNTAPLFAELAQRHGVDVGRADGLRFSGTPSAATMKTLTAPTLRAPELQKAVTSAIPSPHHFDRPSTQNKLESCLLYLGKLK